MNFVFVASEFENIYEKIDPYCNHFLKMFSDCGITFGSVDVIDSRLSFLKGIHCMGYVMTVLSYARGTIVPRNYFESRCNYGWY
jgi:hypothetical protein